MTIDIGFAALRLPDGTLAEQRAECRRRYQAAVREFTEEEKTALAADYRSAKIGFGHAKKALLAKIDATFGPFRAKRQQLASEPATVEEILRDGARKARAAAQETMALVLEATGLR